LSHDLQSSLEKMLNCAIRVVYGFRNQHSAKEAWMAVCPIITRIQHHCLLMLYRHYHSDVENTIQLTPPIKFGKQSCYDTRTAPYFAAPNQYRYVVVYSEIFFVLKVPILVE